MESKEPYCLLCGSPARLEHNKYPGYQEPDIFRIYSCTCCNSSFAMPQVDTSALYENIYKNGNKVPGYNRYWRYARFIKKFPNPFEYLAETSEVYWGVREALSLCKGNTYPLKILEIGSGLGYFTYSLINANFDVTGLEISQIAVNHAKETFGDHFICADLFDFSRQNRESFDVVIQTEVVEHLFSPLDFLRSVMSLLKPGGHAIITSPNKSLYPPDIIWHTDLPPVHYWWLSEDSVRQIAKVLNTEIRFINYTSYYRNKPRFIRLKPHQNRRLPRPYFNQKGELLDEANQVKSTFKPYIQLILIRIPILKKIYDTLTQYLLRISGHLRKLFDKNLIVCGEKGFIFCAVIKKGY